MSYPARPRHDALPQFNASRGRRLSAEERAELTAFVVARYAEGLSLREVGELTDRSWRQVGNLLHAAGVAVRPSGAHRIPGSRRSRKRGLDD